MSGKSHRRVGFLLAFVAGLSGTPGCVGSQHALAPLPPHCLETCQTVPCECRGKVYVFLVNGFDPLGWERVADVRTTLIRAGFPRIYDGQFYHAGWFGDEMRRIHTEEPDARFAVIGIGAGVEAAAGLAESVAANGISIDLLASVDAPFWSSAPANHPANVQNVLAVHGISLLGSTDPGDGHDLELPIFAGFGVPAHPLTLECLTLQLAGIATSFPAPSLTLPRLPVEESPTPRPRTVRPAQQTDEWDFLKPVARLQDPRPAFSEPAASVIAAGEQTALR